MKLHQLTEAPIQDFGTLGNFDDPEGSLQHPSDRRAVTTGPMIRRIKKAWEKTPFDFNLYFVNIPGMEKYKEYGRASIKTVEREFPELVDRIQAGIDNNAINVVYTNNEGSDRVSFTPWIIAHRLSHAMVLPNNTVDPRQGYQNKAFYKGSEKLFHFDGKVKNYVLQYHSGIRLTENDFNRLVYEHIGTMKSARDQKLNRPREFYHELFAQYLLMGDIEFNQFDDRFYEKVSELIVADAGLTDDDLDKMNQLLDQLRLDLLQAFQNGLELAQGKIIFM